MPNKNIATNLNGNQNGKFSNNLKLSKKTLQNMTLKQYNCETLVVFNSEFRQVPNIF
jgi:hypothetical protein